MKFENSAQPSRVDTRGPAVLHESWRALIRLCQELQYGEIERIKIQDGIPVIAELVTRKIKLL